SLRPVFGLPCQTANLWRIKILAQWCRSRHDEPPGFAMLNLTRLHLEIAHESQFQGLGISGRGTSGRDDRQVSQELIVFERSKEFPNSALTTAATTRSGDAAHSGSVKSCVSISSSI